MTREQYHELPHVFAFLSLMPPSSNSTRLFIVESSEPEWMDRHERVQQIRFNPGFSTDNRFRIHQERNFYVEKFRTGVDVFSRVYDLDWWFTGYTLQNIQPGIHMGMNTIPVIDFDSRLLLDIAFEHSHPVLIRTYDGGDDVFRTILSQRLEIQRARSLSPIFHHPSRYQDSDDDYRRRNIYRMDEIHDRALTPPRHRRFNDYNYHYVAPPVPPPRRHGLDWPPRPRNIIVQPAPQLRTHFTVPSHIAEAIVRSQIIDHKSCSITMIPFKEIEHVVITSCWHCFDKEALQRWMNENETCPECRQKIENTVNYRNKIEAAEPLAAEPDAASENREV
jgi:hypothetical protein